MINQKEISRVIGHIIDSRYLIQSKLTFGSFGLIYEGIDTYIFDR